MNYLQLSLIIFCGAWVCYFVYLLLSAFTSKSTGFHRSGDTADLAFDARERLITALLGDYKAADRLIAYEQSIAGPIGCGKLEAVERALQRLERDRSRTN